MSGPCAVTMDGSQGLKASWFDGKQGKSFLQNFGIGEEHLKPHKWNVSIHTHCTNGSKILSSPSGPAPASIYTHA